MAAVVTSTEVVHEDLSDELIQADVRNTPSELAHEKRCKGNEHAFLVAAGGAGRTADYTAR